MSCPSIIFIDDDDTLRGVLTRELESREFKVQAFRSAEGVLESVRLESPDAVLLDLRLPGVDGLELLQQIRAADPDVQVVVLTGHGSLEHAVEAMRRGAFDFLTKPVSLDVLEQTLRGASEKRSLLADNQRLRRALGAGSGTQKLLGESARMRELRHTIERVARSESHVLIEGENGTGKELVARNIHELSPRSESPFVVVNCGAIPSTLVESELFGHEKGAFTGADRKRIGLFEAAHGGSLFLDEIGELPLAVQPALLRAVQFGEIRPVGSDRTRKVSVRVIAATNRKLGELVDQGKFREDLYYRVATLVIDVPPLRARREDIRPLLDSFLARASLKCGRKVTVDAAAIRRLEEYDWPGNVRELESAAERLAVMADRDVISSDLVERHVLRRDRAQGELPTLNIEELEKLAVLAALKQHGGDKRAAAATLGVALKTLYNKLERYGMKATHADPAEPVE
ncbi:MAG: sigma-54-dependent Fis family transcriptional regulator [Planctomycetes bacterium]|nr:sigma-54-dependent Fis family transcriptional regulator [Planctomycetota bacterium]